MGEPKRIWDVSMEPVRDRDLRNKMRCFINRINGMGETSLQKLNGLPIYIWYANSQRDVTWRPASEPIFYEVPNER